MSAPGVPADLEAEFVGFDFAVCRTRDGLALEAQRRDSGVPGVHTVITPSAEEMRRVLAEDRDPPDSG